MEQAIFIPCYLILTVLYVKKRYPKLLKSCQEESLEEFGSLITLIACRPHPSLYTHPSLHARLGPSPPITCSPHPSVAGRGFFISLIINVLQLPVIMQIVILVVTTSCYQVIESFSTYLIIVSHEDAYRAKKTSKSSFLFLLWMWVSN